MKRSSRFLSNDNLFLFYKYFSLYSIIAPNTLRPNSQYHVAVSIHKAPEPAKVKVGIIGGSYSDFKTVEVRPLSTELVHFEVGLIRIINFHII